ncbi:FAD-binding domain-containing protein [Halocola ammonii]
MVYQNLLDRGFEVSKIEKFIQELAWRDYWQQIWVAEKEEINKDLKREQPDVRNHQMPKAVAEANTGVEAIDDAIREFYDSGYLHNHLRMYIASICCNFGKSHWWLPAQWMYYHLLDGDWASNGLSWQWVAGSNSNKQYVANQKNVNKYCKTDQQGTFMDVDYSELPPQEIPERLQETVDLKLSTELPPQQKITHDSSLPTLIYNYYNLDPDWHKNEKANRILLLEPSVFEKYPISKNALQFALELSKNIPEIQIFVGEFKELQREHSPSEIIYKEHPLNYNYMGKEESRDWMFSVTGYYSSFFKFWKKCKKEIKS